MGSSNSQFSQGPRYPKEQYYKRYVQGHVNISGRYLGDEAAKNTSLLPLTEDSLPYTDYVLAAIRTACKILDIYHNNYPSSPDPLLSRGTGAGK